MISLADVESLTGGRLGMFNVACPICSPYRKPAHQRQRKLRIWRREPDFAGFYCAHCGLSGYAADCHSTRPDPTRLTKARAEAAELERLETAVQLAKARRLWARRQPIAGTLAETYLRSRGITGPLPATLGYLPPGGEYPPSMIAAFGMAREVEPGVLAIADADVAGVHLTRLRPDGLGKAGTDRDKIMIGRSIGVPIVLSPPNDGLGLAIAEGIEDALTVLETTGLGTWAAGSASRLPALAGAIPDDTEVLTVMVDDDAAGQDGAAKLAAAVGSRMEVRCIKMDAPQ